MSHVLFHGWKIDPNANTNIIIYIKHDFKGETVGGD
jgi:hypothetical protein